MRTIRTLTALTGLLLASSVWSQWPCDSMLHASFTASPLPTDGMVISVANTSWSAAPNNTTYVWSFGDGTTFTGNAGLHAYNGPGTYTICLFATTGNCFDSACVNVVVQPATSPCQQLNAGFSASNNGTTVQFLNDSPLNTVAYSWTFGDSTSTTGRDPVHTYSGFGQYEVCLKATTWDPITQAFCDVVNCEWITVVPDTTPAPCDLLDSTFTASIQGNVAVFTPGTISGQIQYMWSFGDGASAMGPVVTHTYAHPGQYYACMTATAWDPTTQDVCRVDNCQWITIHSDSTNSPCDQLNAGFQVTTNGPTAQFHQGPTNLNIVYHWSFGDGTTAFGPNPLHTYAQPGQYHACLIAWAWDPNTQDSCMADHCEWVTIHGDSLNPCDNL
ncbi:MAG TPA: PKD domain-containing protein, partial [Flavobacteriales bacterium]|nr:PKD domain-containing protein [Flavobacteriales bacterium]